jgi:hypothetical protein
MPDRNIALSARRTLLSLDAWALLASAAVLVLIIVGVLPHMSW